MFVLDSNPFEVSLSLPFFVMQKVWLANNSRNRTVCARRSNSTAVPNLVFRNANCQFADALNAIHSPQPNSLQIRRLSNAVKRLIEVGDYIIGVFKADRNSHQTVGNSQTGALFSVD